MDEENSMSMSSFDDQENNENLDKENQLGSREESETNEQQRLIYEQQQYQRSQFYEQQEQQQQQFREELDENQSPATIESTQNVQDVHMETEDNESNKSIEPVPDYLIEKIDQEKWPGVNGHYDSKGKWREWYDLFEEENNYSGELVTILPYVSSTIDYLSLNISC